MYRALWLASRIGTRQAGDSARGTRLVFSMQSFFSLFSFYSGDLVTESVSCISSELYINTHMCICVRSFILYTHACIKCQSNTYFKVRLPAKYQLCHLYPSVIEMVLTNFPFDKQDRAFGEIKKSFKIYVVL